MPVAVTVKVAGDPAVTVTGSGWTVMIGAVAVLRTVMTKVSVVVRSAGLVWTYLAVNPTLKTPETVGVPAIFQVGKPEVP